MGGLGQGVGAVAWHGAITCVLQIWFSSLLLEEIQMTKMLPLNLKFKCARAS